MQVACSLLWILRFWTFLGCSEHSIGISPMGWRLRALLPCLTCVVRDVSWPGAAILSHLKLSPAASPQDEEGDADVKPVITPSSSTESVNKVPVVKAKATHIIMNSLITSKNSPFTWGVGTESAPAWWCLRLIPGVLLGSNWLCSGAMWVCFFRRTFLEGGKELGNRPHVVLLCFQELGEECRVCWQDTAVHVTGVQRLLLLCLLINLLFVSDRQSSTINPSGEESWHTVLMEHWLAFMLLNSSSCLANSYTSKHKSWCFKIKLGQLCLQRRCGLLQ